MRANQASYPVTTMCRMLGVSPSGYYAWRARRPSTRAQVNARLVDRIRAIHKDSRENYGSPNIHAELVDAGWRVNRKRVARLMRVHGIVGVTRRRGTSTTRRDRDARPAPDLVERAFTATAPNQLWVADITYIPTWAGFLYLAVVVDVYSRRIVGWAMENHLRTELVLQALNMALGQRRPDAVIHHSDQGCQGGFKGSSQHLREVWRWSQAGLDARIELCVGRCVHPVVPRRDAGSIGRGSGKKSLVVYRVRRQPWQSACHPLSARAGSANVVVCHLSIFVPSRGASIVC